MMRFGQIVIDRSVVVEIKSVNALSAVHEKQLLTYLREIACT